MDKLLCTLGMGFIVGIIKVKEWMAGFSGMVKGEDGFLLMMGICAASLTIATAVVLLGKGKIISR